MTKTTIKNNSLLHTIIGEITSTHGLKGDLFINANVSFTEDLASKLRLKPVQVRKKDCLLFDGFLGDVRPHKRGLIIQLEDVHNLLEAEVFKGAHLWVWKDLFTSGKGETIYLSEMLGFSVYDKNHGFIGYVTSFSDNGVQDILVVRNKKSGLSVDVLFIPEFVMHIDFKKSLLFLDLPLHWPGL